MKSSTGLTAPISRSVNASPFTTTTFSSPLSAAPSRRLCRATLFMSRVASVRTASAVEFCFTQRAPMGDATLTDLPGL